MTPLGNAVPSPRAVLRGLVAVLIAGALTVLASAAASAASYTHRDPAGDVVTFDGAVEGDDGMVDPKQARGDVVATAIAHTRSAVVLKVRLRAGLPSRGWFVAGDIRTPRGAYDVTLGNGFGASGFELTRAQSDRKVRCSGLRRSITSGRTVVRIVVPRSCLGNPRVVRAGVGAITFTTTDDTFVFHADDALRPGTSPSADLRLSPRLRRG